MESAFYRNRLPHIVPPYATFFITFRLADSLSRELTKSLRDSFVQLKKKLDKLSLSKKQKELDKLSKLYFREFDRQLDNRKFGPTYLREKEVANILIQELKRYDGILYHLQAFCIMPNHVHLLVDTTIQEVSEKEPIRLDKILKKIKGSTAVKANKLLNRRGSFWQKESYDHLVRNQKEWDRIYTYILNNPVKAGLVENHTNWPFSFGCNENEM